MRKRLGATPALGFGLGAEDRGTQRRGVQPHVATCRGGGVRGGPTSDRHAGTPTAVPAETVLVTPQPEGRGAAPRDPDPQGLPAGPCPGQARSRARGDLGYLQDPRP